MLWTERMAVPAVPSSLLEPIWTEFTALLPERGEFHPDHPFGLPPSPHP
jgi:hypothetical protein